LALPAPFGLVGNESRQFGYQWIEIVAQNLPHDIESYLAITVNEPVAHAGDVAPRDFGMTSLRGGRDLPAASPIISSDRMTAF
jgi:hypothetical protein